MWRLPSMPLAKSDSVSMQKQVPYGGVCKEHIKPAERSFNTYLQIIKLQKRDLLPKYQAFAGAFLTQFIVIGLMFAFGVLFKEFETQFGWSRTLLSSCTSLAFFVMGVLAFFAGRFSDTYGPRPVLAFTGIAYGIGYILLSQVTQPWQIIRRSNLCTFVLSRVSKT